MSQRTYSELKRMTHGEKYCYYKECYNIENHDTYARIFANMPRRLPYKDAVRYYTAKIKSYFDTQLTTADFDSVEDYYDYFEARRAFENADVRREVEQA